MKECLINMRIALVMVPKIILNQNTLNSAEVEIYCGSIPAGVREVPHKSLTFEHNIDKVTQEVKKLYSSMREVMDRLRNLPVRLNCNSEVQNRGTNTLVECNLGFVSPTQHFPGQNVAN